MQFPELIPVLDTTRLRLRGFTLADAPAVQRLAGAQEVARSTALIPHPYPDGVAEQWIRTHPAAWSTHRGLSLALTLRSSGELIGAISLTFAEAHARAELGYWIGVPHWGRGYATEAAHAVTDYGFRTLGLRRVQAHHYASNPASGRVMMKIGLRPEGVSPEMICKDGRFEDVVFYGITSRDWPGRPDSAPDN
jgi:RimJ/RimL family protein N-acetyltransferase